MHKRTKSISFVLLVWIDSTHQMLFGHGQTTFKPAGEFYVNPAARMPLPEVLHDVLRRIPERWPAPVQSALNARYELDGRGIRKGQKYWGHSLGGLRMSRSEFRMSARELVEALAVDGASKHLTKRYELDQPGMPNPFLRAIMAGETITAVELQRQRGSDDDWIEFHFAGPDPAISRFEVPARKTLMRRLCGPIKRSLRWIHDRLP